MNRNAIIAVLSMGLVLLLVVFALPDSDLAGQASGPGITKSKVAEPLPLTQDQIEDLYQRVLPIAYDSNSTPIRSVLYYEQDGQSSGRGELLLFDYEAMTISQVDSSAVGLPAKLASIGHLLDFDKMHPRLATTINQAQIFEEGTVRALSPDETPLLAVGSDRFSPLTVIEAADRHQYRSNDSEPCVFLGVWCFDCQAYANCADDCDDDGYGEDCTAVCDDMYQALKQAANDVYDVCTDLCDATDGDPDDNQGGRGGFWWELEQFACHQGCDAVYGIDMAIALAFHAACLSGCGLGETACKLGCMIGAEVPCEEAKGEKVIVR